MNREEKIGFLKGLQKGTMKIKDILPGKYTIRVCKPGDDRSGYYIDGIKVTQEQFLNRSEPVTGINVTLLKKVRSD